MLGPSGSPDGPVNGVGPSILSPRWLGGVRAERTLGGFERVVSWWRRQAVASDCRLARQL